MVNQNTMRASNRFFFYIFRPFVLSTATLKSYKAQIFNHMCARFLINPLIEETRNRLFYLTIRFVEAGAIALLPCCLHSLSRLQIVLEIEFSVKFASFLRQVFFQKEYVFNLTFDGGN